MARSLRSLRNGQIEGQVEVATEDNSHVHGVIYDVRRFALPIENVLDVMDVVSIGV